MARLCKAPRGVCRTGPGAPTEPFKNKEVNWLGGQAGDRQEMGMQQAGKGSSSTRGFASMDPDKQREIARKGGRSVPNEKRSFSQNHQLASEAGRKGGHSSHGRRRTAPQGGG